MSTTRTRCEIPVPFEGLSGSKPEDQDELSCESCFQTKAEILQATGNYCLHCWQQETHPDI
ncbi:MAG: hypothetical protein M3299_07130 [Thermoproteota archaeon]|nr:hypothetical protein [Thermoproteota archaeon]